MPQQSTVARVAFAVGVAGLATATLGGPFTVIAESGEQAPGLSAGVVYGSFDGIGRNDAGTVAFRAFLVGDGVSGLNDDALVVIEGGAASIMARAGEPAGGLDAGLSYRTIGMPTLHESGGLGWLATVSGNGIDFTNDGVAYAASGGTLLPIRIDGFQANGLPAGIEIISTAQPFFGPAGRWAFWGRVAGTGIDLGNDSVVLGDLGDGLPSVVAREGSPAPGFAAGFAFSTFGHIATDTAGRTVFQSRLRDPAHPSTFEEAIFATTSHAGVQPLFASGDPITGVPGASLTGFGPFSINETGRLAIAASLAGSPASQGIVVTSDPQQPAPPEAVAVRGSQAGGLVAGVVYEDFFPSAVQINAGGRVAFRATVAGTNIGASNDRAVFSSGEASSDDGSPVAIAREGDRPPGYPAGSIYQQFDSLANPTALIRLNDVGQTAFYAYIDSNDLPGPAIFATDTAGVVRKILGTGDTVDLGGSVRTVQSIRRELDLSNHAEVLLAASFTDGSQAVLLATIPPPVGPCAPIDYALPYGELTFADITAFLTAFANQDPAADLAEPVGQFTFADISTFLAAFSAGCP